MASGLSLNAPGQIGSCPSFCLQERAEHLVKPCKKYLIDMEAGMASFHYHPQINLSMKIAPS